MIEDALKAGKAAARARYLALKLVKPGVKIIDIANALEDEIIKQGCVVGFPCNISINDIAAHDTPMINDDRVIMKGDLVKVDIGACSNGVLSDTARTIEAGVVKDSQIIKCIDECMEEALKVIKSGAKISGVGNVVGGVAEKYGFTIVKNLVGHGLGEYIVHTGISIPNYRNNDPGIFKDGDLVAIEPYITKGVGKAVNLNRTELFSLRQVKSLRIRKGRQLLDWIVKERRTLPFCKRWLTGYGHQLDFILNDMVKQGVLVKYPVLRESGKMPVAQKEHTILLADEPIITTK